MNQLCTNCSKGFDDCECDNSSESFNAENCVSCETPDWYWVGGLCSDSGELKCISCCYCDDCHKRWSQLESGEIDKAKKSSFTINEFHDAESQESMILEACGICDKDFASETLNADGYCGSCCDTRLAEFEAHDVKCECGTRIGTDEEIYMGSVPFEVIDNEDGWKVVCMKCAKSFDAETDDEGRTAPNECPTCGETDYMWVNNGSWDCDQCSCLVYDAESKGVSNNAQIALGLTALGVGLALWKSNDILNLFNKFRGE